MYVTKSFRYFQTTYDLDLMGENIKPKEQDKVLNYCLQSILKSNFYYLESKKFYPYGGGATPLLLDIPF